MTAEEGRCDMKVIEYQLIKKDAALYEKQNTQYESARKIELSNEWYNAT